jgi:hypothetical protein
MADLILDAASTPEAISQLAREIEDPEMQACIRRWVMQFEFEWFAAAVLHLGERVLKDPWLAWMPTTPRNAWRVRVAAVQIRSAAKVLGPLVAAKRRRGRPVRPDVEGHVDLILRDRLLGTRSTREVALRVAPHLIHPWEGEHFYEYVKRAARKEVAPPPSWHGSTWAKATAPLREVDKLRITEQRKRDIAPLRRGERGLLGWLDAFQGSGSSKRRSSR